jgi:hypothetical protein
MGSRWQLVGDVRVLSDDSGKGCGSGKLMEELHDNIGNDYRSKEWMGVQGLEVTVQGLQEKPEESVNKK